MKYLGKYILVQKDIWHMNVHIQYYCLEKFCNLWYVTNFNIIFYRCGFIDPIIIKYKCTATINNYKACFLRDQSFFKGDFGGGGGGGGLMSR